MVDVPKENSDAPADPRERLLAATLAYVAEHGLSDLSLRELARAIGTSHRMLIYHFGSKQGLLVAIVQATEQAQRDFLAGLAAEGEIPPGEALRMMWTRLTDPALAPHERLFFEIYGQALQGRPGTAGLFPGIVESWLVPGTAYWVAHGMTPADARAETRLGLAIIRGLLLDLLATEDLAGVDGALERYAGIVAARSGGASQ